MDKATTTKDKRATLRQLGEAETWFQPKNKQTNEQKTNKKTPQAWRCTIGRYLKNTELYSEE